MGPHEVGDWSETRQVSLWTATVACEEGLTVVGDNAESHQNAEELAETAHRGQAGRDETADAVSLVPIVPGGLGGQGGHEGGAEAFKQDARDVETGVSGKEDLPSGNVVAEVDRVVGSVRDPADTETDDGSAKGQDRGGLDGAGATPRAGLEVGRALAEHDEEDDGGDDGGVALVGVDDPVAAERGDEREQGDDDDADREWQPVRLRDGAEDLGADNRVDRGPADGSDNVLSTASQQPAQWLTRAVRRLTRRPGIHMT